MGYTHYWRRPAILPLKEWRNWTEELKPLMEEEGKVLADVFIGEDEVYFNGNQPCETFILLVAFHHVTKKKNPMIKVGLRVVKLVNCPMTRMLSKRWCLLKSTLVTLLLYQATGTFFTGTANTKPSKRPVCSMTK